MRLGFAVETVAQFNHCTSRKNRRAFARYLLHELRSLRAEVQDIHRAEFDAHSCDCEKP